MRVVLRLLTVCAFIASFFAGLFVLAHWAERDLYGRERYRLRVHDVECAAPPGKNRLEFLDEVQYYSRLPRQFDMLDGSVPALLESSFARHPWVEKVRVEIDGGGRVQAHLEFRKPVLAVRWQGQWRAVDGNGVLLPRSADTFNLPRYAGQANPPHGPEGTPWGDERVAAAAKAAAR